MNTHSRNGAHADAAETLDSHLSPQLGDVRSLTDQIATYKDNLEHQYAAFALSKPMVCRKMLLPILSSLFFTCWASFAAVLAEPLQVHIVFSNHLVIPELALVLHNTCIYDYVEQALRGQVGGCIQSPKKLGPWNLSLSPAGRWIQLCNRGCGSHRQCRHQRLL